MIHLSPVIHPDELNPDFKRLYTEAFPPDERREWQQLVELAEHPKFTIFQIFFQNKFVGFISKWNLSGFSFIEHFAIRASVRGKGLGSQVICQLIKNESNPFILEAEEPLTNEARRRIRFYEKLRFKVNSFDYYQPPYSTGKKAVKMLLMSYPEDIPKTESVKIIDQIHRMVYRIQN